MNLEEAKQLKRGDLVYNIRKTNADGTAKEWKVASDPVFSSTMFIVSLKREIWESSFICYKNLKDFSLTKPKKDIKNEKTSNL